MRQNLLLCAIFSLLAAGCTTKCEPVIQRVYVPQRVDYEESDIAVMSDTLARSIYSIMIATGEPGRELEERVKQ